MGLPTSTAAVFILCACGTGLTLYAAHVQRSKLEDASYRALCDLDDTIACSEYLAADEGFQELVERLTNLVGVPYSPSLNPHSPPIRVSFFPIICLLGCLPFTPTCFLATLLTSISSMLSAYLLYQLFYVKNQICLPCIGIYFLHLLLFVVLTVRWAGAGPGSKQEARPSTKPSRQKKSEERPKETESSDEGSKREKSSAEAKMSTQSKKRRKKKT